MAAYDITLKSCDDSLRFEVDLDNRGAALIQRIARMSEDLSDHGCQPYMTVTEHTEETDE
jgi:cell division protein FtsB